MSCWMRTNYTLSSLARIYTQSSDTRYTSSCTPSLVHLNIDLQGTGITLKTLDCQLLSCLPQLQSLIYYASGKSTEDADHLTRLSRQLRRIQFIRKGLSISADAPCNDFKHGLVLAIHKTIHSKHAGQSLLQHTLPYPDKVLNLPFLDWKRLPDSACDTRETRTEGSRLRIYDRVNRVRVNLAEIITAPKFPPCRYANHLTLISDSDTPSHILTPSVLSSLVHLSSVRHLIVSTSVSIAPYYPLFATMHFDSLDIAWSQLDPSFPLASVKSLSLTSECVFYEDVENVIMHRAPHLEHLQMNVTTSDACRRILDLLLSSRRSNALVTIKICICQTLSDQSERDLAPMLSSLSSHPTVVKWRMDSWYLYIWK